MPKRDRIDKNKPNTILFLVEGESDKVALEMPLSELIYEKYPEFQVRFLLQEILVNKANEEVDLEEDEEDDDEIIIEEEYKTSGDITSSIFVTPQNIEKKIEHRFIRPAIRTEGIYPKRIAKIIQIVDLDGVYLPDERVVKYSKLRENSEKVYYKVVTVYL